MHNTICRTAAVCLATVLLSFALSSCGDSAVSETTGTDTGTDTVSSSTDTDVDLTPYYISGATTAYPDMPAILTYHLPNGETEEVLYDEYRFYQLRYKEYFDDGDDTYWDTNPDMVDRVKGLTLDEIKRNHVVLAECREYGISLTDEEVASLDEETASLVYQFGGIETFDEALANYYMTEYFYNSQTELSELYDKLDAYYEETGAILTEDDDIRTMLDTDDFIRCKHILIKNDVGDDVEENRALIETIYQRLLDGEDFDTLMSEFSEDTGLETYPDGYYFFRGEMEENFEEASFALAEGEMSGIVESSYGYHIILRCAKDETYIDENFDTIKDDYLSLRMYQLLDEAGEDWTVTYCENYDRYEDWSFAELS